MNEFQKRINLRFPLKEISKIVIKQYNLGSFISNRVIFVGYEDFNYILKTSKGKFVVKIFSLLRSDKDCQVLVHKAFVPYKNEFSTPKIYEIKGNTLFNFSIHNQAFRLCVMDYIDGKDFYRLGVELNENELKFIAKQVAK